MCCGIHNHISRTDTSQTRCHLLFMSHLRGGIVVPHFWENGLSDLPKVVQQSSTPSVHRGACDPGQGLVSPDHGTWKGSCPIRMDIHFLERHLLQNGWLQNGRLESVFSQIQRLKVQDRGVCRATLSLRRGTIRACLFPASEVGSDPGCSLLIATSPSLCLCGLPVVTRPSFLCVSVT